MGFLIHWTNSWDLVAGPAMDQEILQEYQAQFDAWIHDKQNKHEYWMKNSEGEDALCYGAEAFVKWLNETVFKNSEEKMQLVRERIRPTKEQKKLPYLNF